MVAQLTSIPSLNPALGKMLAIFKILNQVRAGLLRIALSTNVGMHVYVCVCVCLSAPRLLITSGVIQTPYDWLNKFYGFYMTAVVGIVSGCDVSIHTRRGD